MLCPVNWPYGYEALWNNTVLRIIEPVPPPGVDLCPVDVVFIVNGVALKQVFLRVFRFFRLSDVPSMPHTYIPLV